MSKPSDKVKITAFDLDLRVRDRNLASGILEQKFVDKQIADLPDLESHAETIDVPQPALGHEEED